MASPNYNFEKRRKEIAKKKKQEQKLEEKRARKAKADAENSPDQGVPPSDS